MTNPLTTGEAVLTTLGPTHLTGGSGAPLAARRKELALLTYLACRSPAAVAREELAALLWGERDSPKARQSLRQALLDLRRALGPGLEVEAQTVRLRSATVALDVHTFELEIKAGQLESAVNRWAGDFLEALDDVGAAPYRMWLEAERERLRRLMARALERLALDAEAKGDWETAERWASRRTTLFPLDEAAHTQVVRILRTAGKHADADARHAAFVARYRAEMECEPSAELARLGQELSAQVSRGFLTTRATALFTPDLIGRESAYAELTAAWREATAGHAPVVLVEGEPGVGKTRLCEEFIAALGLQGDAPLVLRGRARPEVSSERYMAAIELLGGLRTAPGLLGADRDALAALRSVAPWIDDVCSGLPTAQLPASYLPDALRQTLIAVSDEAPVVLFLDDATEADTATWELLSSVALAAPARVLMLLTSAHAGDDRAGRVRSLATIRGFRRLKLLPLRPEQVDAMLASMLAMPADERRTLAQRLHLETGGNPLYVCELTSALADEGWLSTDANGEWHSAASSRAGDFPIPPGVREALGRRLTLLGQPAKLVATAAAIVRGPVDTEALAELTGLPAALVSAGLDELIERRMLRPALSQPTAFEFVHDLMRRTAAGSIDQQQAAALHGTAAAIFARRTASDPAAHATALYHRGLAARPQRWGWRTRNMRLVVVAAVALLAVVGVRLARTRGATPTGLVILPFRPTVESARPWSEALPDLLATTMQGTPGLRVVDPWAAWRHLRDTPSSAARPPETDEAEAITRGAGAEWYVIGSLVEERRRLKVSVRLYRIGSADPRFSVTQEASVDSVLSLSEELAVSVMAQLVTSGGNSTLGSVEARATQSPEALKAYLAAKEAMRRGQFDSADVAIDHALALDSTFGLALIEAGLIKSLTANLRGQGYQLLDIADRAVRHSVTLGERHRLRAQALLASVRTEGRQAANAGERLVQLDSSDVLAWAALSYVHLAYGWQYGATLDDAIDAAEHVVMLDSTYVPGLYARAWLALASGASDDVIRQRQRLPRTDTTVSAIRSALLAIDALLATGSARDDVLLRAERAAPPVSFGPLRVLLRNDPASAETLLVRLADRWRGEPAGRTALATLARLLLAECRAVEAAAAGARRTPSGTPNDLVVEQLVLAAAVAGVATDTESEAARRAVESYARLDSALVWQGRRHIWSFGWLLGAYHASVGDTVTARRWAETLGRLDRGKTRYDFAHALEADIEARLAVRRNDLPAALAKARKSYDLWLIHTENISEALPEVAMRFHLARLLRASAFPDSAIALFRSLTPPTTWVGFYSTLAALELAETLEQQRDLTSAQRWYGFAWQYLRNGSPSTARFQARTRDGLRRAQGETPGAPPSAR